MADSSNTTYRVHLKTCGRPGRNGTLRAAIAIVRGVTLQRDTISGMERCPYGHLFSKKNTYVDPRGWRKCRQCRREKMALSKESKRLREPISKCECGCGGSVQGVRFILGHNQRGCRRLRNPDSVLPRTGRQRAARVVPVLLECHFKKLGHCTHRLERAHLDQNPMNNAESNIGVMCSRHHGLFDKGKLSLSSTVMPKFRIDKSGKYRYADVS